METNAYLDRLGIEEAGNSDDARAHIARLQRAHITSVPFENLSIVGHPFGTYTGEPVELELPHIYSKLVEEERGGYCFEMNGLFHWLLTELGYEVYRVAAQVVSGSNDPVPANHLALVVELEMPYLIDVGLAFPKCWEPIPLYDRTVVRGGHRRWRAIPSDRPDQDYLVQFREEHDSEWTDSYLFSDTPRKLHYFAASNDFLQTAPESPFTTKPIVNIATDTGYRTCSADQFTVTEKGTRTEYPATGEEWSTLLKEWFGLHLPEESENT